MRWQPPLSNILPPLPHGGKKKVLGPGGRVFLGFEVYALGG